MDDNKEIEETYEELEKVSGNEELRRIAELKIKGRRDREAELEYATEHGYENGKKDGIKKNRIEIVKNMLKEGVDKKFISKVTGLTEKEVDNICEQK